MSITKIEMPMIDANEDKATLMDIYFDEGDKVKCGDVVMLAENMKTTCEIDSPADGYFLPLFRESDEVMSGDTIAAIFDSLEELKEYKTSASAKKVDSNSEVNATKKAISLAEEMGIDIKQLAEERGQGVIREKDVQDFAKAHNLAKSDNKSAFILERERVVIIGASDGAEVIIDILLDDPTKVVVGLVDDNIRKMKNYDYPILDCSVKDFPDKYGHDFYDTAILSIGANQKMMKIRREIFEDYVKRGVKFTNAIAKSAEIRRGVKLGVGNVIGSGCYIGTLSIIGDNNSISYGVNIGHHNIIGSHNLIAPGVFLSGSDMIGDSCVLPAGVAMVNRCRVGDDVVVPVGYAITNNIKSETIIKNRVH